MWNNLRRMRVWRAAGAERSRIRLLRALVRIGDYKVDSYYGSGQGVSDILPLDGDELALRHQIWLATDQAYKERVKRSLENCPC